MDFHQQEALSWRLAGSLILLVLAFDFLAVFLPHVAGREVVPGSVISIGIVFAAVIVVSVIVVAVFYVRKLNIGVSTPSNPGATPER